MTPPPDEPSSREGGRSDRRLLVLGLSVVAAWIGAFVFGLRWFDRLARGRGR